VSEIETLGQPRGRVGIFDCSYVINSSLLVQYCTVKMQVDLASFLARLETVHRKYPALDLFVKR